MDNKIIQFTYGALLAVSLVVIGAAAGASERLKEREAEIRAASIEAARAASKEEFEKMQAVEEAKAQSKQVIIQQAEWYEKNKPLLPSEIVRGDAEAAK